MSGSDFVVAISKQVATQLICEPNTHMPRVKGSGATCSAFSAEPKCKGCMNKRPCHRRPANRLADCSCGYCGNLSMQVPVEVDKGEGQLEKPSTRCSRRQMKPNAIVNPTITAEKRPTYQTAAAQEAARRRRKKRQARYQNNKKSEGTNRSIPALSLDKFICIFLFSFLVFLSFMGFLFQF